MRRVVVGLALLFSAEAGAQQSERSKVQMVLGCWKVEPGQFVAGKTHVDPGQTNLPTLVRFDSVPGINWTGDTLGRRIRALAADTVTQYHDGYYRFPNPDSVDVDWTNGFTGMSLALRLDKSVMRGRADAWTDYMGSASAPIVLRRASCPRLK